MRAYSMDLRTRVLEAAAAGGTTAELADRFSVGPAWVRRLRQRHRKTGEVGLWVARPARTRTLAHLPRIRDLLAAAPDLTPAELRAEPPDGGRRLHPLGRRPGARVHVQKVVRAAERDRPDVRAARAAWRDGAAPALDPARVVFVDGTAANATMDRRYGYAPRGRPVVGSVPRGHDKSLTFTAALRADGVTAPQVLDGPRTAARFREYVAGALVPALRPGDAVVLDNLPCHESPAARAAVEAAGCRLVFLPPYRPDLSPIELAFARLKRLLRSDGHRSVPALVTLLGSAGRAFRPAECGAYVRHGGYGQPPATDAPNQR